MKVLGRTIRDSLFPALCLQHGLPEPTPEYKFDVKDRPGVCQRQWRFDWCWPDAKLALEIDGFGAAGAGGRHQRVVGIISDQQKGNRAIILGWRVLHCLPKDVDSGAIFETIRQALAR